MNANYKIPHAPSPGEELLAQHLRAYGIAYQREVELVPGRKWRSDFLVGDIAIEVDGGVHGIGRHQRARGFEADCQKMNSITAQGYRLLRFTTQMVQSGEAIDTLLRMREGGDEPTQGSAREAGGVPAQAAG
jgi:very-short-patch-repair endonuclease